MKGRARDRKRSPTFPRFIGQQWEASLTQFLMLPLPPLLLLTPPPPPPPLLVPPPQDMESGLEQAAGDVGVRVRKVDKKAEKQLLAAHR